MTQSSPNSSDINGSGIPGGQAAYTAGEAMLDRVKFVARQITERIRKLTDESNSDNSQGSSGSTSECPPLS